MVSTISNIPNRLVHLIDNLFSIMKNDPDYAHFMLDGQTIVLEDYLQIRPENEKYLKELIAQEGS